MSRYLKKTVSILFALALLVSAAMGTAATEKSGKWSTTYAVTVEKAEHGTAAASSTRASMGVSVVVRVSPSDGYVLDALTVMSDGSAIAVTEQAENEFMFRMPGSDVTVTPAFRSQTEPASSTPAQTTPSTPAQTTPSAPSTPAQTTPSAPAQTTPAVSAQPNPFTDVPAGKYYTDAVLWAVQNGITKGTTDTTFSPGRACTRAQTVTFLWRAAGSPAPRIAVNPFTDVQQGSYFYQAVLWAVENGITKGTTNTTFSPGATVSRAQVVTFLYRASGSTVSRTSGTTFTDLKPGAYYQDAVTWAAINGVTSGTSNKTFGPNEVCTRGQIVTFLYRAQNL